MRPPGRRPDGRLILARLLCLAVMVGLGTAQVAFAASAAIVQVTADGTSSVRPSWSRDGSRIAFQSSTKGNYRVYTMAADGSDRKVVSQGDVDDRHPSWSPDGTKLAVDSGTEIKREIWVLDIASGARTQVSKLDGFASFPAFSPDGSKLSFYNYKNGALDIWTVGVDGSNPDQVTQGLASETKSQCTFACHVASWSPDGSRLAFADGDQLHVWTMRADDGTDRIKVSEDDPTGRSHFPAFLADGRLAYVTEHINPGQSWTDIWAVDPNSGQKRTALLQDVQVQGPFEFSPDGQKVLFASPRNGSFDIYMADLANNGKEALQQVSSETQLAPALAAGHPTQVPLPQAAGAPGNPVVAPATPVAAPATSPQTSPIPDNISPYILALIGLAGAWVVVEGVLIARRRMRRRSVRTDGE